MEKQEYRIMFEKENTFWWYRGLHDIVLKTLENLTAAERSFTLLDAGCGTGRLLELINSRFNDRISCKGIDFSEDALSFCNERNISDTSKASVCDIPFSENSFDFVTSLDVIYHQGVEDDIAALKEFKRILKPEGKLILNLPAYEFMKSRHDSAVHTARRYNSSTLKDKLSAAGFRTSKITYRNSFLFPLAFTVRMLQKLVKDNSENQKESDLSELPKAINIIFEKILFLENAIINNCFPLPFGLSVFCIAEKDK
ncbi:MAG: class I SAM-dependent methyltransferase [Planctomycetota bacterium]